MERIEIEDVSYAYKIWQHNHNRPNLLMLHGFMGDGRVFEYMAGRLTASCNPVTLDLLGHGRSTRATSPYRYSEQRQIYDMLFLIDKLDIAPLYLYGYSMGGRLALKTALAAPNIFLGLMLESTNDGITDPWERKIRLKEDEQRAREIETNFEDFLSAWQQDDLFKSTSSRDPETEKKYKKIQAGQNPSSMAASLRGFGTGIMIPAPGPFRNFLKPVLLLAGTEDKKYIDIGIRMSKSFPLARFCGLEGGHRVHLDNPEDCCREITNFIDLNHMERSL